MKIGDFFVTDIPCIGQTVIAVTEVGAIDITVVPLGQVKHIPFDVLRAATLVNLGKLKGKSKDDLKAFSSAFNDSINGMTGDLFFCYSGIHSDNVAAVTTIDMSGGMQLVRICTQFGPIAILFRYKSESSMLTVDAIAEIVQTVSDGDDKGAANRIIDAVVAKVNGDTSGEVLTASSIFTS